ncbi:hypothetical protein GOBAR_DD35271 [Gossypium barbadense]|nr:hypothetical protein GOBAR_DD35271 [Gossypium barbadense]
MVAAKKTKKTHESINNRLALVMKSGKYTLGYKIVFKSLRSSKGQELQKQLEAAVKELKQVQELFSQAADNCLNLKQPD